MTKKSKPASAKGWCVVNPSNDLCVWASASTKHGAISEFMDDKNSKWPQWQELGYRVVRFTATEVVK